MLLEFPLLKLINSSDLVFYRFKLEGVVAPSRNNCYNYTMSGPTFLKKNIKNLKTAITYSLIVQKNKLKMETIISKCSVMILHYRKHKTKVDVMNLEKIICDAMTDAQLYKDDVLIEEFYSTKIIGCGVNNIEIMIIPW